MRRYKAIVIGLGEIGKPIYRILQETHGVENVYGFDMAYDDAPVPSAAYSLHICLPWSNQFVGIVKAYQALYEPELTIVHSTVPIGTSDQLEAVHSPVLGRHPDMYNDIANRYVKWFGGVKSDEASDLFKNLATHCVMDAKETELLKLICLAKYGKDIAFANYAKDVCEKYGFSYETVLAWDHDYNNGVPSHLRRPLIYPSLGAIGGHCVVPGTKLLNDQHPNQILDEVLQYDYNLATK